MRRFVRGVPALLCLAACTTAVHAAQRVYVASTGVDSAPCTLGQPCRSFSAAHAAVDAGGEIVALDAAGYGAVGITKSVTITANPGVFAGIAAATGNAVTIDAPGGKVTLRGLQFNGTGAEHGIVALAGASLEIDNCVVSNFASVGISVQAEGMKAVVTNTVSNGNGATGLGIYADAGVTVARSQFNTNLGPGVMADGGRIVVADSLIAGNQSGLVSINGSDIAAARIKVANNANGGIVTMGGSVLIGNSQVSNNGQRGFHNISGFFGSLGDNQLVGHVMETDGVISPVAPQ